MNTPANQPESQQLVISRKLAQSLVDYLKKRPFDEVFELINGLLRLPAVPVGEPEKTTT